jgi:tRNA modification GTPase
LQALLAEADRGIIYRQGVRTAIIGRPNVGKSSLLNCLLRTSRAIVTEIPGTTRDTLEETLNLQGLPVILVDTAGITARTDDPIERLGIERSRVALSQADLALLVIDASQPLTDVDYEIAALIGGRPAIVALNKIDLVNRPAQARALLPNAPRAAISALTGEGIQALEDTIAATVFSGEVTSEAPMVTSPRHREALNQALEQVNAALESHRSRPLADLVAVDVTAAVSALGEITGQTVSEDLLDTIFSRFCIGK